MLRPSNSFGKHAETEDIQHEEVYRSAAAHGEPYLQVGAPPQACFVDESGDRGGKATLVHFSSFVRRLPISYVTLVYRRSQFEDPARLMERGARHLLRHG